MKTDTNSLNCGQKVVVQFTVNFANLANSSYTVKRDHSDFDAKVFTLEEMQYNKEDEG